MPLAQPLPPTQTAAQAPATGLRPWFWNETETNTVKASGGVRRAPMSGGRRGCGGSKTRLSPWCTAVRPPVRHAPSDDLPLVLQVLGVRGGGRAALGALRAAEGPREPLEEVARRAHCPQLVGLGHCRDKSTTPLTPVAAAGCGARRPLPPPTCASISSGCPVPFLEALAEPVQLPALRRHPGWLWEGESEGAAWTAADRSCLDSGCPRSPPPDLPVRHVACPGTFFQ